MPGRYAHDATYGMFSAQLEDDAASFGPWPPVSHCGLCGHECPDGESKADHLRQAHGASVIAIEANWGESMYEWRIEEKTP